MTDLAALINRPEWMQRASCRGVDTEKFFPHRGDSVAEQKAICRDCPVRRECLTYAMNTGERHGIWGGLSEHERRRLRRQHGLAHWRERDDDLDEPVVHGTSVSEPLDLDSFPKAAS